MSCKNLLLGISEILRLFFNILTAEEKHSRHNIENFLQQIQMQLSQKPKDFSSFSVAFPESTSNCVYFEKKNQSYSLSISEIIDSERGGYLNV